jgi:uncharacterized membrane protein
VRELSSWKNNERYGAIFGLNEGLLLAKWRGSKMVVERKEAWLIWRQRNTEVGGGEFVVFFGPVVVGFGRDKEDSFLFFFFILVMFKIVLFFKSIFYLKIY